MIIAATGHRPDKLGGYDQKTRRALGALAVEYLHEMEPDLVISGMALGWDQAVASACVALGVPFDAAVPFESQSRRWPEESRRRYEMLCNKARTVHFITTGEVYGRLMNGAMQARNEWMVDHADRMVALWNGSWGGTFNCLQFAEKQGKPVDNLWAQWAIPEDARDLLG